jgi:hypothetical protein
MNTNEQELANNFFKILRAQETLSQDEAKEIEKALNEPTPEAKDDETPESSIADYDSEEAKAVKDLIPWDSFSIIFDPHYSKKLEEENQLPPMKAKSKSYYIYYTKENKRIEGIVNKKYVGGYGTKEDMGEDLSFIKSLSEQGFPPDWEDKILVDIDKPSITEDPRLMEKVKPTEEDTQENEKEIPEENNEQINEPEESETTPKKPEPEVPQPIGKVDTSNIPKTSRLQDLYIKRLSRLKEINTFKKGA